MLCYQLYRRAFISMLTERRVCQSATMLNIMYKRVHRCV